MMISCDNKCENCGKYTSVQYNGGKETKYNCLIANKDVKITYDENGDELKREVY